MEYIQVKNWDNFQHYKDRTPPWIKLYNHLLDDFEFSCLPDASKAHLLSIWLLASRTNNKIPNNARWIGNKINATEDVNLDILIESGFIEVISSKNNKLQTPEQDASNMLQTPEQDACLEREERREEKEKPSKARPSNAKEVQDYFSERGYGEMGVGQKFIDHYDSIGWKRGKQAVKDWKATARTWMQRMKPAAQSTQQPEYDHEAAMKREIEEFRSMLNG